MNVLPLGFLLLSVLGDDPVVSADSRVDAVTVYASAAQVQRSAKLELPPGDVRVVLPGLTPQLLDDSIRVKGSGSAQVKLFGVAVETVNQASASAPEVLAATARVQGLQRRDRELEDSLKAVQARREFVDALKATYAKERGENLPVRPVNPREWESMADFVTKQYGALQSEARKADHARKELALELRAAQAELQKLTAKSGGVSKRVTLELRVEKAGAFALEASYVVPSAGWRPLWDVRLDPDKGQIDLSLFASIQQSSGEDWSQVKLAVSSARPTSGVTVPELSPIYLEKVQPEPVMHTQPARRPMAFKDTMGAARAAPAPEEDSEGANEVASTISLEQPPAFVTEGMLSSVFSAPRRESVEGTGKVHKTFLASYPLEAQVSRTVVPRIDPQAYLTATATNGTGIPLFAAQSSIFLGDQFVGTTQLPNTPPGEKLTLAFGADDRIKVERTLLERNRDTSGVFSKQELYKYRVRSTVKNLYPKPMKVTLSEPLPVSRDKEIQVTLKDGSTKPDREEPNRPGVRIYELMVPAKGERQVELRYEVKYPQGTRVTGME